METLVFNRVPKVGSQTMMELLKLLAKRNNFKARRDTPSNTETVLVTPSFERALVQEITNEKEANSYVKHVAYIEFEKIHHPRPIYFNLVRDPLERLISWFYYVRAPWYIAERKRAFPKAYKLPSIPWLQKTFDSCILQHDNECTFEQNDTRGLGDHRRQVLFFCGQDPETCLPFNSYESMQKAKRNVESNYAVVGTWEETNITLTVLENYIPRFFQGAAKLYFSSENHLNKINRNSFRPIVSDNVRNIVKHNLTNEIEFYNFCKQRLYKQYLALTNS